MSKGGISLAKCAHEVKEKREKKKNKDCAIDSTIDSLLSTGRWCTRHSKKHSQHIGKVLSPNGGKFEKEKKNYGSALSQYVAGMCKREESHGHAAFCPL